MSEEQQVATQEFKMPTVKLGITTAGIKKLANKYPAKGVPDVTKKDGMLAAKSARREISKARINLEDSRKTLVSGAVDWQKKVNKQASAHKAAIIEIETPYKDAIKAEEEWVAQEKLDAELKEKNRVEDIEELINYIRSFTGGLLGADVETIEARLVEANKITITDKEYMEFVESASIALSDVKDQLGAAIKSAKALAAQQVEIDKQQKELNDQRASDDVQARINGFKMCVVDAIGDSVDEILSRIDGLQGIEVGDSFGDLCKEAETVIADTIKNLDGMADKQRKMDLQQ